MIKIAASQWNKIRVVGILYVSVYWA